MLIKGKKMQKKCLTALVKDQEQPSTEKFNHFHSTMNNSDEPTSQGSQEPSTDIEVHLSIKVSKSTIKTGIGAGIKVLVSMLTPFLLNAHNLNVGESLQFPVCRQQPSKELQLPKEVSK